MLLALRTKLAEGDTVWGVTPANRNEKFLFQAWSWIIRNRGLYDVAVKLAAMGQKLLTPKGGMIRRLPPPVHAWTKERDIRPLAAKSFISRWKKGIK
jgi:L-lactate dehydrogenase complex protein LldF